MAQSHILPTPDLFYPSEKAEIYRGTFFYKKDDILKFWRWLYFFKIKMTRLDSQSCASDRDDKNSFKLFTSSLSFAFSLLIVVNSSRSSLRNFFSSRKNIEKRFSMAIHMFSTISLSMFESGMDSLIPSIFVPKRLPERKSIQILTLFLLVP